jgi:predicted NBD/HSP70 family sugar kinase
VLFGGGVASHCWDLLRDPVTDSMRRHVMDPAYLDDLETVPAQLGDDSGLFGALAQAHVKLAAR